MTKRAGLKIHVSACSKTRDGPLLSMEQWRNVKEFVKIKLISCVDKIVVMKESKLFLTVFLELKFMVIPGGKVADIIASIWDKSFRGQVSEVKLQGHYYCEL